MVTTGTRVLDLAVFVLSICETLSVYLDGRVILTVDGIWVMDTARQRELDKTGVVVYEFDDEVHRDLQMTGNPNGPYTSAQEDAIQRRAHIGKSQPREGFPLQQ